jgi:TRAP-type C4-dicarboxylate transport system substrate-binding protein
MKLVKLIAAACAALGSAGALAQTTWDMPTPYPESNFHTENIKQFVADVEKAANGKLKITVHSNASLFKAPEIKRAVQGGQAQIGEILLSGYSNEDPIFGVDSVPFLATSYADARKLWAASKQATEARFEKQGMMILYSVAELAQAFATGAVNANITSGSTGYDTKAWEVVKHYYDTQAWLPKNVVFVNRKAFDALDKPTQQAVLKAAAAAEKRGWKTSEDKNAWYLEQLKKNGMTVEKPSKQLESELKKIGVTMTQEWLEKAGPDGKAIIDAYKK